MKAALAHPFQGKAAIIASKWKEFSAVNRCFSSGSIHNIPCDIIKGPSLLRTTVHRPRPSLLHMTGLRSLPFWTQYDATTKSNKVAYQDPSITAAVTHLQENWEEIAKEYKTVAPRFQSDYQADTEHTKLHTGQWDWHSYMLKGQVQGHFAQHFPQTATVLQELRAQSLLFEGIPFGYTFFSTLHPQSTIASHTAPMNLRVRVHLALQVPTENEQVCGIRVGNMTRPWNEGVALVLDDSYDHQVWNNTTDSQQQRVVLLVDLWHPDITMRERQDIVALFQHAKDQGWWSAS